MTPKERAAMQQALEALEEMFHSNSTKVAVEKYNTAHNALLEALKQPDEIDWIETNKSLANEIIELKKQAEQEPVAWLIDVVPNTSKPLVKSGFPFATAHKDVVAACVSGIHTVTPLYTMLQHEVTESSISDHKSEQVMVSVDFMRQLEARFSYYGELVDGEWGNCRDIEELDAAHLLPEEVYQIRKILEEAPVFGFTQAHTSDKPLHHYALVLRDLDKTIEGWCEEPEFYLNGERIHAAPVSIAKQSETDSSSSLMRTTVRTKDLTDDEIHAQAYAHLGFDERGFYCGSQGLCDFASAVIAADREKNNV